MKAIAYARESTKKQKEKDLSVPAQLRAIRAYAHQQDWEIVDEFVDRARSGREHHRPGLETMVAAVRAGRAEVLIVWKLERLARDAYLSKVIRRELALHGVQLVSLNEPTGNSPQEKLVSHMFEGLAEFYSDNLSQDIRRGQREVARQGFYPFSHAPIGYERVVVKSGRAKRFMLVPDTEHGPTITQLFAEYASGRTVPQLVEDLNTRGVPAGTAPRWTPKRLYYVLKNSTYCGDVLIGDRKANPAGCEVVQAAHEALVDRATFQRVQAILATRAGDHAIAQWEASPYLLSGLLRCGLCGHHMVGTAAKSGQYLYYTCQQYHQEAKGACPGVRIPKRKIEELVLAQSRELILDEQNLALLARLVNEELGAARERAADELRHAEAGLLKLRAKLQRNYEALESGKLELDDLAPRIRALREEIREAERALDTLRERRTQQQAAMVSLESVLPYAAKLRETLRVGSFKERKAFLAGLITAIVATADRVEIQYRLPIEESRTEELFSPVLHAVTSGGGGGSRTRVRNSRQSASTGLSSRTNLGPHPPTRRDDEGPALESSPRP